MLAIESVKIKLANISTDSIAKNLPTKVVVMTCDRSSYREGDRTDDRVANNMLLEDMKKWFKNNKKHYIKQAQASTKKIVIFFISGKVLIAEYHLLKFIKIAIASTLPFF